MYFVCFSLKIQWHNLCEGRVAEEDFHNNTNQINWFYCFRISFKMTYMVNPVQQIVFSSLQTNCFLIAIIVLECSARISMLLTIFFKLSFNNFTPTKLREIIVRDESQMTFCLFLPRLEIQCTKKQDANEVCCR